MSSPAPGRPHPVNPDPDRPIDWEPSLTFLNYAVGFILIGGLCYVVALRILLPEQTLRAFVVATLMVLGAAAGVLLGRGKRTLAVWLLAVGAWLYATLTAVFLGGVSGTSIILYPLVILMVGWLLGTRGAALFAVLSTAVTFGFVLLDAWSLLPPAIPTAPFMRWLIQAGVFLVSALLIVHVVESYRKRLAEVRSLHEALTRRTAELQEREADLTRAQTVAQIGSWVYDIVEDRMRLSAETCRIFGVPEGTVGTHDSYLARVHRDDRTDCDRAWHDALAGGAPFEHEHRILVGGVQRWVRQVAQIEFDDDGRPRRSVGTTQDVTARRQHEAEAAAAREHLQATIDAIPDLMFEVTGQGRYLACHVPDRNLLVAPVEQLVGRQVSDVMPAPAAAECLAALREADERGRSHGRQIVLPVAEGERWFELSISRVLVAPGHEPYFIVLSRDITDRRRAQQRLGMAIDVAQLQLWELDLTTGLLTFEAGRLAVTTSPTFEQPRSFGGWLERVHPDDRAGFRAAVSVATSLGDRVFDHEYRLSDGAGGYRWIHTIGRVTAWSPDARPLQAVGTSMDITPRKEIEAAVRASEERSRHLATMLQLMCDNVPDMIWAKDLQGRYLFANRAVSEQLLQAVDTNEPIGRTDVFFAARARTHAPDNPAWHTFGELCQDSDAVTLERGTASVFEEFGNVRGELLVLDVHKAPFIDERGELIGTVGCARDITARQRAEAELRETSSRLSAVFHASPVPITVTRMADGHVVDANEAAYRLFGLDPQVVRSQAFSAQRVYAEPEQRTEVVRRLRMSHALDAFPIVIKTSGGDLRAVEVYARVVALGGEQCLISILMDTTEREKAARALVAAREAADAANRAKSEFLANMSHEIRTPLNGVIGNAQLLAMSPLSNEQLAYLSAITASGTNLLSLLNDILDLSKIEASRVSLESTAFSLRSCLNYAVTTQRFRLANKDIEVDIRVPEEVPDVLVGDELRIKQVLVNLVSNAVKFTPAGRVDVSARFVDREGDHGVLECSVADTGIGIPEDMIAHIFEPFVQADSTISRRFGGTGLGLAICRRLAQLMGGAIEVESVEGQGTTFRLRVPLAVGEPASRLPPGGPDDWQALWPWPPLRVLLAEDNDINREFSVALLRKMKHEVTVAADGREALEAWARGPFDLVLMDVRMPVMEGTETLHWLREQEEKTGAHTPVIALTAHALRNEEQALMAAGFDGYVSKPVDVRRLVAEMRRLIEANAPPAHQPH